MHKFCCWLCILFTAGFCHALPQNVALNKPYQLEPKPNYPYCTDPGDTTQLTDGKKVTGLFWTQPGCVGWSGHSPVVITIDLQTNEPISGMSFSTAAASVSGVSWPSEIYIWVSDDQKVWHVAGDLVALSAKQSPPPSVSGNPTHRFETDALATHGRFVKLIVVPTESYVFSDEIEIYRGPDSLLKKPTAGPIATNVPAFQAATKLDSFVRRRLTADLASVREHLHKVNQGKAVNLPLKTKLDILAAEIPSVRVKDPKSFQTIFPLNETHQKIFAVQSEFWRAQGLKGTVVWAAKKWDMLMPTDQPSREPVSLDVQMMRNEFRSAAVNVSNASDKTARVRIAFEGIPGGPLPDCVTLQEVPFTDTLSGVPIAAALPEAQRKDAKYEITIPSGMTRQLWLTVNSKKLSAGEYAGLIVIDGTGSRTTKIPLKLKIYPIEFPDQPTLHLGGWDYTDGDNVYQVTQENREILIRHLREHFVDTPWAQTTVMPTGKYDSSGKMIAPPDPTAFRNWVKRWPNSRNYFIFPSVDEKFAGLQMGTPAFSAAVTAWINWWADELARMNIKPEQVGLLLVDEPREPQHDRVIIEYAKVIRAANRKFLIFEDPIWNEPWKGERQMFELSDILCPNLPMCIEHGTNYLNFYLKQRDAGRRLWFYSCHGPGKLLDPYSYHRMQQWFCWKHGAEGAGFWAFGDSNGASTWNEYFTGSGAFTPLFLDEKTVTAGKHMEAIREGVEDYEYLRMLRDRIKELEQQGATTAKLKLERYLLDTAAYRVTACMTNVGQIYWSAEKDRNVADEVRIEILEALNNLR